MGVPHSYKFGHVRRVIGASRQTASGGRNAVQHGIRGLGLDTAWLAVPCWWHLGSDGSERVEISTQRLPLYEVGGQLPPSNRSGSVTILLLP